MKIFSGSSNKPLAEKVAKDLKINLSPLDIFIFPDQERRVRVIDKVLDEKTVIVQSTSTPADQHYMELFFITDALKRSGASSVTAVIPYLGYQRQDHVFREGEAVSLQVIIETLQAVGINKIVTFDLHSAKIPSLFEIEIKDLSALPIFADKICGTTFLKDIVLVSPDMGGIRRIKILSELLNNVPYATIEKNRDLSTGYIESKKMEGDVEGKTAIIVDDMISTGKTIDAACKLLKEKGAVDSYVFATHPVFSNEAPEILQSCLARKIFVADSIDIEKKKRFDKLEVLSISKMIASEIA